MTDERTWKALLGDEAAGPGAIYEVEHPDEEYKDDLSAEHGGGVWLMGEGRWERTARK